MTISRIGRGPRGAAGWRQWPLLQAGWPLRLYLIAVPAAAAAALVITAAGTAGRGGQLVTFAALLGCGLASVEATRRIDYSAGGLVRDLLTVWCLPVAILLPPVYALVAPVPLMVMTQLRVHRGLAYRRAFSAASIGLGYAAASAAFHALPAAVAGPLTLRWPHALAWALAVAGCDLIAWTVNNSLIVAAIKASDRTARIPDLVFSGETLIADYVQWNLAVVITVTAAISPVLLVFDVPAVLMQRRFMMHQQLLSTSRIDQKTGLLNAVTWRHEAEAELARAARTRTPAAIAMLDIDKFKAVNDTHGHPAGDTVLAALAAAMRGLLRDYDLIGRWGGEEFAIMLPHATAREAGETADRLRQRLAQITTPVDGRAGAAGLRVTVSIGVAATETAPASLDDLIAAADAALYYVKETGRNAVRVSTEQATARRAPDRSGPGGDSTPARPG